MKESSKKFLSWSRILGDIASVIHVDFDDVYLFNCKFLPFSFHSDLNSLVVTLYVFKFVYVGALSVSCNQREPAYLQ